MKYARLAAVSTTVFVTLLTSLVCGTASANAPGPPGYTGKPNPTFPGGDGCGRCHTGGPTPQVQLTGPDTIAAGAKGSYTLRVTASGGTLRCVVGATAGVDLTPTSASVVKSFDELTPSGAAGGNCTFEVQPMNAGSITIYYGGASTNGSGTGGDGFARGTKVVSVTGTTPPPTDGGGPRPDASAPLPDGAVPPAKDGGSTPTSDGGALPDGGGATPGPRTPGTLGPTDEDGGCNSSGGPPVSAWGLVWSGVVAGALLLSRRRSRAA
ncbi:MAG: hypothetical protein IPF92_30515 [Myxococcales bacterium]|jgi:hypothetical protein|nr:hypothetical protein [Myxococcales bacterium]